MRADEAEETDTCALAVSIALWTIILGKAAFTIDFLVAVVESSAVLNI